MLCYRERDGGAGVKSEEKGVEVVEHLLYYIRTNVANQNIELISNILEIVKYGIFL